MKKRIEPSLAHEARRRRSSIDAWKPSDTKARFRLNVALPIAFDGFGTLERLTCDEARVVVEHGIQAAACP